MSSRFSSPITSGSHRRGTRSRTGQLVRALREGAGPHLCAQRQVTKVGRWLNGKAKADDKAIRVAREVLRRALERRRHVDMALIERLQHALARVELRADAARLGLPADAMAEIRRAAGAVILQLFPIAA